MSPRLAIIGRPNVGKSTLLNRLAGEERMMVDDKPGTTRDAVDQVIPWLGDSIHITDTAGIRKRGRISSRTEQLSVFKSLSAVRGAHIILVVIDATEGITNQDLHIMGGAIQAGRGVILLINKWDRVASRMSRREMEKNVRYRLRFGFEMPLIIISAKTGSGVSRIMPVVDRVRKMMEARIDPVLLDETCSALGLSGLKQTGIRPPRFSCRVPHSKKIHFSKRRNLVNSLRKAFDLGEIPIKLKILS